MNLKEQIDFYTDFKDWYFKIIETFQFNYKKDCRGRNYLSQILKKKGRKWDLEGLLVSFKNLLKKSNNILIYGCGPSLEPTVDIILKEIGVNFVTNCINLAADGASVLLKNKELHIDAIFSDLDGITKEEFNYPDFMIVHAHGDNIEKLKKFKNEILNFKNIIGTTQVEPLKNLINPGGFTDGDRILYFLRTLLEPKHKLFLIGMDFNNIIGKYSKLEMDKDQVGNSIKVKKLKIAIKLIIWLTSFIKNKLYFVNSSHIPDPFKNLSLEEFRKLIL
ncbi:MAG: 6-hydroxymethylpterin diphosphokinase MptE-like protein [Promethearchaeota archaeon]